MPVTRTHPPGTQIIRTLITPASRGAPLGISHTSRGGPSTASAFGGINGGMGPGVPIPAIIDPIAAAAGATTPVTGMTTPVATGPLTLTSFGSSVSKASVGIMNTFGSIIPLAIKVIVVVIVIKIILWLIKRRR